MANVKISQLPVATTPLTGAELLPVVQSGITRQTTINALNDVNVQSAKILLNIAALQALSTATSALPTQVQLTYNYVAGDGGGVFRYDSTDVVTADNGGTVIVDSTGRRWKRQYSGAVDVRWFGARGDNATNDTTAIQAALTFVRLEGGGEVYFPEGTYIIIQSVYAGSKTTISGDGASSIIKASQTGYVGVNTGVYATTNCQLLKNYNFAAAALTDTDIVVRNMAFDWGNVTIAGGGAHSVSFRFVNRVTIENVFGNKGENVTALQACQDTVTSQCVGINQTNCFFDHWDGSGNCHVINCTGRSPDVYINQGIQVSGAGSFGEDRSSLDCLVAFCSLYRVRGSTGNSSAIISNGVSSGSTTYRFRSIGNYVNDADLGIVFEGSVGQHISTSDTFTNVTGLPVFIRSDGTDPTDYANNCRVIDAHLIDCDHAVANVALVSISGTGNEVRGLKVTNTGAAAYDLICWFTSNATNCLIDIASAANGLAGRIQNNGTNCKIIDEFDAYVEGTYTPVLSFGGLSTGITYASRVGYYTKIGEMVFVSGAIVLSSKGSATGVAKISLPFTSATQTATGSLNITYMANVASLTSPVVGGIESAVSTATLRDAGASGTTDLDDTNFANSTYVYWSGSYRASA